MEFPLVISNKCIFIIQYISTRMGGINGYLAVRERTSVEVLGLLKKYYVVV